MVVYGLFTSVTIRGGGVTFVTGEGGGVFTSVTVSPPGVHICNRLRGRGARGGTERNGTERNGAEASRFAPGKPDARPAPDPPAPGKPDARPGGTEGRATGQTGADGAKRRGTGGGANRGERLPERSGVEWSGAEWSPVVPLSGGGYRCEPPEG